MNRRSFLGWGAKIGAALALAPMLPKAAEPVYQGGFKFHSTLPSSTRNSAAQTFEFKAGSVSYLKINQRGSIIHVPVFD